MTYQFSNAAGPSWGDLVLTLTTLNCKSVPTTTIARAGNVNAQYEAPERCTATRRNDTVNAAAPRPINSLLETRCNSRPAMN